MYKEISIFNHKISTFAVCIVLGFLFAIIVLLIDIKKRSLDKNRWDNFFAILPFLIIGGFAGAIIFDKIAHFREVALFELAGMSFAGGILSAIGLYLILYPKFVSKNKNNMIHDLNILVCPLLIAHSLGRIGCFMGGCCYGKVTNSIFGVMFPEGSLQHLQYGYQAKVLPTQLFESAFLLILFFVLYFYKKTWNYRVEIYLMGYGLFRFLIEFLRGDNRGSYFLSLSPSQWTSILFMIGGMIIILVKYKKRAGYANYSKKVKNN